MTKIFQAEVQSKEILSERHFILKLKPQTDIIPPEPGQFFLIRTSQYYDPFLRRPFSVFNHSGGAIEFLIMLKGRGTEQLLRTPAGASLELIGPLGRGFEYPEKDVPVILAGGGIGIAPLYFLAKKIDGPKIVIYGAGTASDLVVKRHLLTIDGVNLRIVTEDGSEGSRGTVVDELKTLLVDVRRPVLYICGPAPMIEELKRERMFHTLDVFVSVEERMACGVGVCLGCAYPTTEGFKRVCMEGPVFSLRNLL